MGCGAGERGKRSGVQKMGVLGAVYGVRASYIGEEKQEKWCDSTAHLSPGLATC